MYPTIKKVACIFKDLTHQTVQKTIIEIPVDSRLDMAGVYSAAMNLGLLESDYQIPEHFHGWRPFTPGTVFTIKNRDYQFFWTFKENGPTD